MASNFNIENDISESPINQIFNLQTNQKTTIPFNFTLQIINIKPLQLEKISSLLDSNKNNNLLSLTLSDQIYFYNGFILFEEKNSHNLNLWDLIDVQSLTIFSNAGGNKKIFVIKNFNLNKKFNRLIGSPRNITNLSQENQINSNQSSNSNIIFIIFLVKLSNNKNKNYDNTEYRDVNESNNFSQINQIRNYPNKKLDYENVEDGKIYLI